MSDPDDDPLWLVILWSVVSVVCVAVLIFAVAKVLLG